MDVLSSEIIDTIKLTGQNIAGVKYIYLVKVNHDTYCTASVLYVVEDSVDEDYFDFCYRITAYFSVHTSIRLNILPVKANKIRNLITKGSVFYINACQEKCLIYAADNELFKLQPTILLSDIRQNTRNEFDQWNKLAPDFYDYAVKFIGGERNEFVAFMLHQASEQILRAFLIATMGIVIARQSILQLMDKCLFMTNELAKVMPYTTLQILNLCYRGLQPYAGFRIDSIVLSQLNDGVNILLLETERELYKVVNSFTI